MTTNSVSNAAQHVALRQVLNRRRFLALLGGAGALGAVGCSTTASRINGTSGATVGSIDKSVPSSMAQPEPRRPVNAVRQLVVIEMAGGNDGLAMLQPYESGVLRDQRDRLMAADQDLIDAGSGFGWHPNLAGLADLGIAAAVGIGSNDPNFSHFEMEQRWWRGVSEHDQRTSTGFFGRLCDQLDVGAPVTGLSLSGGPSPGLSADKAITVGLTEPGISWFFGEDDPWFKALRSTMGEMAKPSSNDTSHFDAARGGLANTLRFAESLSEIPESDTEEYPWSDLGQQLRFAADVMDLDVGVRVLHVKQGGYDTHSDQEWEHPQLMEELNDATVAFVNDLTERGRIDDTLIVTTSEFGRRVTMNDGGTDHGGASTMMVCKPGGGGVHGEAPNLAKLDDGNVVATARFEDYYATIAENWFDIPAAEVLPTGGTPIQGLI